MLQHRHDNRYFKIVHPCKDRRKVVANGRRLDGKWQGDALIKRDGDN